MFRPLRLFNKNAVKLVSVNTNRTKIIFSESFLDKAQRLKLWDLEDGVLFGSVIESSKSKPLKLSKERSRKVSKNKPYRLLHTDVLVPFSLNENPRTPKKVAAKSPKKDAIESKLGELISAKNVFTKKIQLQIDHVPIENFIKDSKNEIKNEDSILCSGLPLKVNVANIRNGILIQTKNEVPSIIKRNLRLFPMLSINQKTLETNTTDDSNEDKILRITSTHANRQLPSVTKVLEQTMSAESKIQLEKWKTEKIAELGAQGFEEYQKKQLETGSKYHDILSKYLTVPPPDLLTADPNLKGLLTSVSYVLKCIKSPKAIESHIVHPVLKYQGVIDCIAYYKNKPTLIEWKTSNSPKKLLSRTYDNPIQLAAYFGAISHDLNYKSLNVRDAMLVIAYTDGSPADIHHLTIEQLRQQWALWLIRLEKFWASNEKKECAEPRASESGEGKDSSSKG